MEEARLTMWEWLEGLGLLGGFILLVVANVADAGALGWAALAALVLGYGSRLVALRNAVRAGSGGERALDRSTLIGLAAIVVLAIIAASLTAAVLGLVVAAFRGTSYSYGAWAGARAVLIVAAAVIALQLVELAVKRLSSRR